MCGVLPWLPPLRTESLCMDFEYADFNSLNVCVGEVCVFVCLDQLRLHPLVCTEHIECLKSVYRMYGTQ